MHRSMINAANTDALNVAAHELRDPCMAQPHDLIPLRGGEAFCNAQTLPLDEAGLQLGDGHIANVKDDGTHDHQCAEYREQQRQLPDRAFNRKQVEHGRHRPGEPAGRQARSNHDSEQRNQQDQAQAFEHRAKRDKDRGEDALAAGKGGKIAQEKPQVGCDIPAVALIGIRNRHCRSSPPLWLDRDFIRL